MKTFDRDEVLINITSDLAKRNILIDDSLGSDDHGYSSNKLPNTIVLNPQSVQGNSGYIPDAFNNETIPDLTWETLVHENSHLRLVESGVPFGTHDEHQIDRMGDDIFDRMLNHPIRSK